MNTVNKTEFIRDTMQYRYTILFKPSGQKYHGSKYSKDADPNLFWKTYFTSSKIIASLINEYGINSFEILEIILHPNNDAYECEKQFLIDNDCANSNEWINQSNNDYNLSHADEIFKKRMMNKYGVDHNTKSPYLLSIRYKLHEEKYGNGIYTPFQRPEVKDKIKITLLKKYGVDHHMKLDNIKEKIKNTCSEKYGVEHVLSSTEIQEKIKDTFNKKYGGHPRTLPETEYKKKQTCLQKYGVDSYSKTDYFKNNIVRKVWLDLSDEEKDIIRYKSSEARKNDPIIECEHCCLKVKNKGIFNRFHGTNCKLNAENDKNIIGHVSMVFCICGWFPKKSGERSNLIRHYNKCKNK